MKVSGIYRITNLINNKFYIGQSRDVEYRLKQHLYEASDPNNLAYDAPLHQDIRKYGWDNFSSELLLKCDPEELSIKEQELISAAQIMSKDLVYNRRNDFVASKIAQYSLDGKLIKIWNSTSELFKANFDTSNILRTCHGKTKSSLGYMWRFVENEEEAKAQEGNKYQTAKGGQRREIIQYDLTTREVIGRFSSGRAASIAIGKSSGCSPILNTCKGKQRQAYGFGWAYADEFENWE